jgi:hypothetical protein
MTYTKDRITPEPRYESAIAFATNRGWRIGKAFGIEKLTGRTPQLQRLAAKVRGQLPGSILPPRVRDVTKTAERWIPFDSTAIGPPDSGPPYS